MNNVPQSIDHCLCFQLGIRLFFRNKLQGGIIVSLTSDVYLAVDLGASSGRVLGAIATDNSIELEEVHRFENGPVRIGKRLHWNLLELWSQIEAGLTKASAKYGSRVQSVGVDTWGVDFVLLDKNDDLVGQHFATATLAPTESWREPSKRFLAKKSFRKPDCNS